MTTVHFTSDLHLFHEKVATLRGFETVEAHAAALADRWAERVQPGDTVWVLGDVSGDRSESRHRALAFLDHLPGRKRLILGNHDAAHPMKSRPWEALPGYLFPFEYVSTSATVKVGGRAVLLSHFPYRRDRGVPRHLQWRLADEGAWLIHGHTHGPERLTASEREVHVGLDAWGLRPVRIDEVAALIEEGSS